MRVFCLALRCEGKQWQRAVETDTSMLIQGRVEHAEDERELLCGGALPTAVTASSSSNSSVFVWLRKFSCASALVVLEHRRNTLLLLFRVLYRVCTLTAVVGRFIHTRDSAFRGLVDVRRKFHSRSTASAPRTTAIDHLRHQFFLARGKLGVLRFRICPERHPRTNV